jgi:cardiolipin synthase
MPSPQAPGGRPLAEQALSRAAGAPLSSGNAIELLIDAQANFDAWLAAIRSAQRSIFLANYIIRSDTIGHEFLDALCERARAGVHVCVMRDWLGCLGQSGTHFWRPLVDAGGQVRVWNPFDPLSPFGWINRDHRKLVSVDGRIAFISGVCISEKWLGNPARGIPPWRDTGVALRVIATHPNSTGMYRLDQMIAALARERLWLTDAYFVGVPPYVRALANAAGDGVDVRLLVPGTSDLPPVAAISRGGYRPLLASGVRVFEWNGSMLHAKTAVADARWARVGSTNLNLASWLGNCEIDVAVEDHGFARALAAQYERDLENATEIVLSRRRVRRDPQSPPRERIRRGKPGGRGSAGRGAAGALRLAHSVGAVLNQRRLPSGGETGPLLGGALALLVLTAIGVLWPRAIAWPLAALALWIALGLAVRWLRVRRDRRRSAAHSTQ